MGLRKKIKKILNNSSITVNSDGFGTRVVLDSSNFDEFIDEVINSIKDNKIKLTEEFVEKCGQDYEKELGKNIAYYVDRTYQIYHFQIGIIRGFKMKKIKL